MDSDRTSIPLSRARMVIFSGTRMQDYNILVTFHHNDRWRAEREVIEILRDVGLELEDLMESTVPGLLYLRVAGSGKDAVRKLRKFAFRFPEMFRSTHRWTPIEEWVSSTPEAMVSAAKIFGGRLRKDERWKMEVVKRHYQEGSTMDIILMLTDPIDAGDVDLEDPEKIIKVEIIGDFAGFSLVDPEEYLDINEVRVERGLMKIY